MARVDVTGRIRAGLVAAAAGEALGLPWVGRSPRELRRDAVMAGAGSVERRGAEHPLLAAVAVGWGEPDPRARRALLRGDTWAVAELAAWSLEGRPLHHAVRDHGEEWSPPFRGPRGDREVVSALFALVFGHDDPSDGMLAAVRLGGDTAVLAALTGAVLGCRRAEAVARIPWLERVALPPEADLDARAAALAARR